MPRDFKRSERVAGQMRRDLARLIQQEIKDPEVGFVSLSDVEVTRDLSHAKVFITVFEPEKAKDFPICDVKVRSKEYKEFLAENNLDFALKTSEAKDVELMVEWFMEKDNKKTIGIKEYLFDLGAKYEEPMVKELYEGINFKGKADVISRGMIIDLKTSSDVYKFAKNAPFFGYHTQAYIYNALFEMPMVFFVIGKERKQYGTISGDYYDVGIFNVSPEFIDRGREAVEHALVHYQDYFSKNAKKSIDEIVLKATL